MTQTIKTPKPRTYHIKMKDGTTEEIRADIIQEPSITQIEGMTQRTKISDNRFFYVLFLDDVEVAKYRSEVVEGWRVVDPETEK